MPPKKTAYRLVSEEYRVYCFDIAETVVVNYFRNFSKVNTVYSLISFVMVNKYKFLLVCIKE